MNIKVHDNCMQRDQGPVVEWGPVVGTDAQIELEKWHMEK